MVSLISIDLVFVYSLLFQFGIGKSLNIYPFIWHSISLSLFSSIIGPFGGFFASGFKRAFKIKVSPLPLLIISESVIKTSFFMFRTSVT